MVARVIQHELERIFRTARADKTQPNLIRIVDVSPVPTVSVRRRATREKHRAIFRAVSSLLLIVTPKIWNE